MAKGPGRKVYEGLAVVVVVVGLGPVKLSSQQMI